MSSMIPAELRYTESHEWVRANDDGTVTLGITDHAQHLLGDLVFGLGLTLDLGWQSAVATLLYALALLFGMSHGYANGAAITPNLSPAVFILGLVTAALLVLGYSMAGTAYLLRLKPAWLPIAVRVAGSWIAAVGILVFGMMVRGQ